MFVTDIPGEASSGKYEKLAPTASTGITPALLNSNSNGQAKGALISIETNSINYTLDGTAPTASDGTNVGHEALATTTLVIRGINNLKQFKMINRLAANPSVVKVTPLF